MQNSENRLHVILSAYACEPGKGSEPGVGWRWVEGLSGRVDLTVLTRSNNREGIQREIGARGEGDPLRGVRFLYYDLPAPLRRLKRWGLLKTLPYYFLWQWAVSRKFSEQADAADVVHHLTFCTALCPGFWNWTTAARVIGPVAAPLVPDAYLPLFGSRRWSQALRNRLIRNFLRLPWLRKSFTEAAAVAPANSDMKRLLEAMGVPCGEVMLDTGAPDRAPHADRRDADGVFRLLYAGVLERRKGLELALRAFSQFIQNSTSNIQNSSSLILLGDGPDRERLQKLAQTLGIADHVDFRGRVPHEEMTRHFREADAFLFTSVRDASGGVNLEAMSHGLPVICIAHQGVGDITDDSCALRVPPGGIGETISGLAAAMTRLADDPALRRALGNKARERALEAFSWEEKFVRMMGVYERVGRTRLDPPTSPSSAGG
jgi:glycosyltransferase involved in cell wall biosynthesis